MRGLLAFFLLLAACSPAGNPAANHNVPADWASMVSQARNSTVRMMMWQGDPLINRYMTGYVQPELKKRYGIDLQIAPGQGAEIVRLLMAEQEAGQTQSKLDLCWINGETFYQLRQIHGLYGPFTDKLPNAAWIDFGNPFIGTDFQQKTEGYECPWGNVQMTIIYDNLRTPEPPRTLAALEDYWQTHPGKFTIPYEFTGMTLLKSWMIALAGDSHALDGPFDEARYNRLSAQLWNFINRNKHNFWRNGVTFPESLAAVHQMFANGELDFTMSNNDGEVDNKMLQGVFQESARAFVPDYGSIRNSHYLGIPAGSTNTAGAITVINFLIDPEAQLEKLKPGVWGDGTVLAVQRLPAPWPERFQTVPGRTHAPLRSAMDAKALQEPAPEYMVRLYADFRTHVIQSQ